jgi:hypothetical protein
LVDTQQASGFCLLESSPLPRKAQHVRIGSHST